MELTIGNTRIPYTVRESAQARSKRIVVTPKGVEVVAPEGTEMEGPGGILAFLHEKRRWVFDSVRQIEERHRALLDQKFGSGAKLQYRGRELMIEVENGEGEEVTIVCRSKFQVRVPGELEGIARLKAIQSAFDLWLRERALESVRDFAKKHETTLEVQAAGWRLSDAHSKWGSCGKDGIIRIHWQLVQAPVAALEYVVAHEVTHLLRRNHGPEFWRLLGRTLPDWAERKGMLERWETERRNFGGSEER